MLNLSISGIDRTSFVAIESLRIENILTQQVDRCSFTIRSFGNKIYIPTIGKQVVITNGATTVFGGVITRVSQDTIANNILEYDIECVDYTRILDQHLVAQVYENKTIEEIIDDIVANFCPAGITANQVVAPINIDYIQFKYEPVSSCLKQLADIVGYDWYIDYAQDIYFREPTATSAPIDIEDNTGSYIKDSLTIRRDNTQLRNSIIVRGGEYLGTEFTSDIEANGTDFIFPLPYKYQDFKCSITGEPRSVGTDYISDPNDYDVLYNFNEKIIRFKEEDTPGDGVIIKVAGKPYLPVIVKIKDQGSIDAIFSAEAVGDGKYEYLVIDRSIGSKQAARDRALAEIRTYGETLSEGDFLTNTDGFRAGQRIRINSTSHGVDEYFIINKVTTTILTNDVLQYKVSLITTKTMDFISVMKKILLAENKKIEIKADEILDLVEASGEVMTITDSVTQASATENDETLTLNESFTNQGLDFGTEFVLGPQIPSTTKRVFVLDGSRLK